MAKQGHLFWQLWWPVRTKWLKRQRKERGQNVFKMTARGSFHWSLMKSNLQFGPVAALFPLSQFRQKSRLVQHPKVHLHPQLLDQCGGTVWSIFVSCSWHWCSQSSPGWYPLVLSLLPVASLNKKLSPSWNLKHPQVFYNIEQIIPKAVLQVKFFMWIFLRTRNLFFDLACFKSFSLLQPSSAKYDHFFLREIFPAPESSQKMFLVAPYLFE